MERINLDQRPLKRANADLATIAAIMRTLGQRLSQDEIPEEWLVFSDNQDGFGRPSTTRPASLSQPAWAHISG